jgi:hypothetical protein
MSIATHHKLEQLLHGGKLLREPLQPVMDDMDESFQMADWPVQADDSEEPHLHLHYKHAHQERFSLPMAAH